MTEAKADSGGNGEALADPLHGKVVIWSREHGAYWRPHSQGYCRELFGAGLYSPEEAASICANKEKQCVASDARGAFDLLMHDINREALLSIVVRTLSARNKEMEEALRSADSFFGEVIPFLRDQHDVVDGDYGEPAPNQAMRLSNEADEVAGRIERALK